jgi:hypothetical protein
MASRRDHQERLTTERREPLLAPLCSVVQPRAAFQQTAPVPAWARNETHVDPAFESPTP